MSAIRTEEATSNRELAGFIAVVIGSFFSGSILLSLLCYLVN